MWETTGDGHFQAFLWILTRKQEFKSLNILMMDLFLTNMQLLASQDVNWWTGVMWITSGLLWCFYQLSDGTHSLQMIHCWASNVMLNFSKYVHMKKETRWFLGWSFWLNCFLNMWPWSTKPVISLWGIFVAIANNTLCGAKLSIFLLYQKSFGY